MTDSNLDAFKKVTFEEEKIEIGRKLRYGVIGCGGIAQAHMNALISEPDIEIVAGCDIVPGKAKEFFEKYGVTGAKTNYASHKEMLEDDTLALDAVSICTYNCQHMVTTICALEHGVNVLLEKPFTVTLDEAVKICKAEKKSGKILSIGFQPRFDKNMKMIKKIVDSGILGKIYYIQTGGGRRRGIPANDKRLTFIQKETGGIGALGDIGCYSLDMVLNAIGYPKPLTVTGYTSNFFGTDPNYTAYQKCGHPEISKLFGVDDFAAAFIRLEGDIILDFRISWAMNMDTPGDTLILGTKGGLRIPSTDCWNGTVGGPMKLYREVAGEQTCTEIPILKTEGNIFEKKIRSFINACKTSGRAPVPSSQILINEAIIDGINKSAQARKEIEIDIPEI